jgi:hypothetical protein
MQRVEAAARRRLLDLNHIEQINRQSLLNQPCIIGFGEYWSFLYRWMKHSFSKRY